jgi:uncharacterized membrane protein YedE/YeeE
VILERCPWYLAGPILGALVVGLRAMLNRGFGAVGGYVDLADHVLSPTRLSVNGSLLLGFVLGGGVFATAAGQWMPTWDYQFLGDILAGAHPVWQAAVLLAAGVAIGFGARTAGGCTSGHGVTGTSLGSPASFVATITFFATAVAVAHVVDWIAAAVR